MPNLTVTPAKTETRVVEPAKVTLELTQAEATALAIVLGAVSLPGVCDRTLRALVQRSALTKMCGGKATWYEVYEKGLITGTITLSPKVEDLLPKD